MVGNGMRAVLLAGVALVGVTACGSGELQVADGTPPSEQRSDQSPDPAVRVDPATFAPSHLADRLTCGGLTSGSVLDYAGVVGPDGTMVYAGNPDTPQTIAQRWAERQIQRRPQQWSVPEAPTAHFTFDRAPGTSLVRRSSTSLPHRAP